MANKYDPPKMKASANKINEEVTKMRQSYNNLNNIIANLYKSSWKDETNKIFSTHYLNRGKPSIKETIETIMKYASILEQCANFYENAIDNGDSNLSV